MNKTNIFVETGRIGGRKGGKARTAKKRRAAILNLKKANSGKRLAAKIRAVEEKMIANRELWLKTKAGTQKKFLDVQFEKLVYEKHHLEKRMT